jgi:hypothetical protein
MSARLLAGIPFALCIALYATAMRGHFLSDDMAVIFVLSGWQEHGSLWSGLMHKFAAGLDAQSHYYRPLPFLSFGLDLASPWSGPVSWHVVNLGGHLLAGIAVYRLCRLLEPRDRQLSWAPAFAAALFLLCGTNTEAVAWISGRYDVFATAGLMWAGVFFVQSKRPLDAHACMALACGAAALASKESGVIAPVLVACLAWIRGSDASTGAARVRSFVRDVAPWLALTASYFALRRLLFGSALQVYPGTHPLSRLRSGTWLPAPDSIWQWLSAAMPDRWTLTALAALSIAFSALAVVAIARGRASRIALGGIGAAAAMSLLLLLPHLSGLPASGEGGRLLYTTIALLALSSGLAASALATTSSKQRGPAIAFGALCLALVALNARLLDASLSPWRSAGDQMMQFVRALEGVAARVPMGGYAFVVAPDAIGAAPFARNAEGAMTIPPIQREWLLDRAIVYTSSDLASLPERLMMPVIPILQRLRRNDTGDQFVDPSPAGGAKELVLPSALYCWDPKAAQLRQATMAGAAPADAQQWLATARAALRSAGCGYVGAF